MTPQLWIGLIFTAILVAFLMATFFMKNRITSAQYASLRFLTALCGGLAGGFLAGHALFSLETVLSDGIKIGISGTAGFGLFFTVWFTYPKRERDALEDHIKVSIPNGWTFEQAARTIVGVTSSVVSFDGFKTEQLAAPLTAGGINSPNAVEALKQLQYLSDSLPRYRVELEEGVYHLRT